MLHFSICAIDVLRVDDEISSVGNSSSICAC